jgi:hypothetical protein
MKPTRWLAGSLSLVTALVLPTATAKFPYVPIAATQLKQTPSSVTCQYCHQSANGGAPWNKFGDAIRAQYNGAAKSDIGMALYLTLKANKDSDGDSFSDALEVFAKTLPGDAKSKPSKAKATLEAEFKKAGGVDQYKKK